MPRFECKRSDTATKWYQIEMIPIKDSWAVMISYGLTNSGGEDAVIQDMTPIFAGTFIEAQDVMKTKISDRLDIGYTKIEPKQDND